MQRTSIVLLFGPLGIFFSPTTSLSSPEAKVLKLIGVLQNKLSVLFCIPSYAEGLSYSSFVPSKLNLVISNVELERIKLLGVQIDQNLNFTIESHK